MAKASPIIGALNAGEWSPLLDGRTDLQGYLASAHAMENFMPSIQGPAIGRAGTKFIRAVKDSSKRTWIVPFIKSRMDAYQIEFGDLYCRFYYQRSPVLSGSPKTISGATAASPVVITAIGHGYSNGQDVFLSGISGMTELNNRWFHVANSTTNTFELTTIHGDNVDGTGYSAYVSGGQVDTPYEIVSPYSAASLVGPDGELNIDFVQTGDVLYIADRSGTLAPRKLSRTSTTSWAFSTIDPDSGPYLALNATATTIYANAATGTITLTASASVFTAGDVGSIIRVDQEVLTATQPWAAATSYTAGDFVRSEGKEYEAATTGTSGTSIPAHTSGTVSDGGVDWIYRSAGYGVARITAQSGTTATATVLTRFPQTLVGSTGASMLWRKGAWSMANGYPTCVTFFRERLVWGQGQNIYASVAADFENYAIDSFGSVLTESAISVTVQSSEANEIVGLTEGTVMIVNTIGAEFVVDAPSTTQPLGPNNVRVSRQTAYGAKPIRPIRVGASVMFVQASGRKVRSLQYTFQVDRFTGPDMTVRSEHITSPSLIGFVRQEEPYEIIWAMRSDGVLLSFTFDQAQQVMAWARHTVGTVESIGVIPSPDGTRDDLWMVVARTINGSTRRYIEYIQTEFSTGDTQSSATYADSMLTYSGSAVTKLYGFDHLEGQTVGLLLDGASSPDVVVSNGEITIPAASTVVQCGLRFAAKYATNRIDAAAADGTAQAKTKRITDCYFRVLNTLGGTAGPNETMQDAIPALNYRSSATPMDTPPPLVTGDAGLSWPAGYETDGRIWYINDSMFPRTVVSIMPQVVTQEAR